MAALLFGLSTGSASLFILFQFMTNLRIRTLEPIVISSDEDSPIKVKPVKRHRLEKQPNRSPVQFQTMEPVNEAERRVDTVERQQMDTVERQRMDRQRTNAFERLRNEELLGLPSATVQIPHQGTQWQMDEVFSKRLESPVQRKIKISEESDPDPQSDELDTESQSNVVHETQEKNPFLESLQTSSPKSAQTDSQNEKTPNTGNKLSNNDFLRNFLKSGFRTGFQDVDQEMIHSKPSRLESLLRGMEERSETLSRSVDPLPSIQDAQPVTATQYVQRQAERQLTRKLMERQEKREMTERRMVKEAINAPVEIIAVENVEPTLEPVEDEVLVIGDTFAILGMLSATVYNPDIETLSRGGGDSFAGWLRCGYKIGENKCMRANPSVLRDFT
ncbi:hypothetical protein EDD86DRAFT_139942 [Gorgonomyces haynaldii]|nr:hypothetical protein EDD86DRAFT_139942 [Gorgonomyces haynaldii]